MAGTILDIEIARSGHANAGRRGNRLSRPAKATVHVDDLPAVAPKEQRAPSRVISTWSPDGGPDETAAQK